MNLFTGWKFDTTLLMVQFASTLMMTGLIWFVQVVHYPLFTLVDRDTFPTYEVDHQRLTTLIVLPVMAVELISACTLLWCRPEFVPKKFAWIGLALLGIIWGLTFFVHVPQHNVLATGFESRVHESLVSINWIRTSCWSVRSILFGMVLTSRLGSACPETPVLGIK